VRAFVKLKLSIPLVLAVVLVGFAVLFPARFQAFLARLKSG
jgi:hypothetical protein